MHHSTLAAKAALTLLALVSPGESKRLRSSAFGVPGTNASFDYVVVGGGTAGLTIAARLAETARVAVIEAGGFYQEENGNRSVVPLLSLTGLAVVDTSEAFPAQPLIDWSLVTVPQTGAGNRRIHYAQGKTLGGSSALNTMSYHRGTVGTYQLWADLVDDQSYTFDNLLPFFKKSVQLTPPNEEKRNAPNATPIYDPSGFSDDGGPLQVSWVNWVEPTITWLAKAVQSLGLTISPTGFSSGSLAGHGSFVPSTIDPEDATRSTSESSFLESVIQTTEITIYPHSQAMRVLFDESKKAIGVTVNTQGVEYTLSATSEIVVSAGVFHSPQLLMVSGIGPQSILQSYGIPVIADRPGVGQNLVDQVAFGVMQQISTITGAAIVSNPATEPAALEQYLDDASGPYSAAAGYLSFERLPDSVRANFSQGTTDALATFPSDWPEVEYVGGGFPGGVDITLGAINAINLVPQSRGNVTITSASMADQPSINLGWFTHPVDAEVAVAAFKRVREAWSLSDLSSIKIGDELLPGQNVTSDAEILEYIRNNASPMWHASSTCAMGKSSDSNAVVDSTAKVFGVTGLRVVDNSITPFSIPGHPQASVYMIAEKIADDIKNGR